MVSVCLPSDALLHHLLSYLGVSYLGRGISLHGCSSKAQPLLLTLDEGYFLTAALPDLNQIPYDYTVEVRNRFKGLDLIDRVPDELWNEVHDIVQETGIKTIPWKRNAKKQNGCLGRPYK